jgi:signal transduction histidine kinase
MMTNRAPASRAPGTNSPGTNSPGTRAPARRALDLHSIRFRLTAWHTVALAAVLLAFVAATPLFLGDLTRERSDRLLENTTLAFHHVFEEEYTHHRSLEAAAAAAVNEFRFSGHRVQVYDEFARLVADSDPAAEHAGAPTDHADATVDYPATSTKHTGEAPGVPRSRTAELLAAAADRPALATLELDGQPVRASAITNRIGHRPVTLLVLQTEHPEDAVLRDFLQAIAIAVPLSLVLAGAIGYALARKALMPVMAMGEQAAQIGAESLHERLAVPNPHDELGRLATIFNGLLGRLEHAFTQQRTFMAGASHDLRTPVAILRAEADVALARADRSAAEYRDSLEIIRQGTVELSSLVEHLYTLARADAGHHPLSRADLYLEELLSDCIRAARPLAHHRGVTLHFSPDAAAPLHADEILLRRLVLNLLDNAIRHTPAGGSVDVELTVPTNDLPPHYRIEVRDTGTGLPTEARPFIFDRFYRADPARSRPGPPHARTADADRDAGAHATARGAGLGLPIARWIAEAHGGTLELGEAMEGTPGSSFVLTLPATAKS